VIRVPDRTTAPSAARKASFNASPVSPGRLSTSIPARVSNSIPVASNLSQINTRGMTKQTSGFGRKYL
jgi:hypothetical protein